MILGIVGTWHHQSRTFMTRVMPMPKLILLANKGCMSLIGILGSGTSSHSNSFGRARKVCSCTGNGLRRVKIRPNCVGVDILFNSMAKTLVNYSEFWYLSRIFHSLLYKFISIFIFLLHTFSTGEKTSARLHRERTVRLHYAQWFSLPLTVYARRGVLEPIQKNGRSPCVAEFNEYVILKMWPHPFLKLPLICAYRRRLKERYCA